MTMFDPEIHLNFQPPKGRHSFTELGLSKPHNIPDVCYTEPFQLFSNEGVRMIRHELFQKKFLDRYMRSWERAPCYIGGFSNDDGKASFTKQAWYHPATQAAIDEAFGVALKPLPRENDVGYVNVQLGVEGLAGVYKYTDIPATPLPPSQNTTVMAKSAYDDIPIDAWHKDEVPVVCVVMLSDTSTMEGGETAIRTGDGSIIKARGASMGGALLMQGGNAEHAALRATNCAERVSMVTSYAFANPDADDSCTSLKSADPLEDSKPTMWNIFLEYKLKRLRGRIELAIERTQQQRWAGTSPQRDEVDPWIKEQIAFLKHTSWELFERHPAHGANDLPDGTLSMYLNDD